MIESMSGGWHLMPSEWLVSKLCKYFTFLTAIMVQFLLKVGNVNLNFWWVYTPIIMHFDKMLGFKTIKCISSWEFVMQNDFALNGGNLPKQSLTCHPYSVIINLRYCRMCLIASGHEPILLDFCRFSYHLKRAKWCIPAVEVVPFWSWELHWR